jgi:hypothetical protein
MSFEWFSNTTAASKSMSDSTHANTPQARNVKQHVDRLKDKVMGALEQKRSQNTSTHANEAASASLSAESPELCEVIEDAEDKITAGPVEIGEASLELEHKYTSAFEAWGCETSRTVEMLQQLQQGLVTQKEQQEKVWN